MTQFLADENFNHVIIRGLLRREPDIKLLTVDELALRGWSDPALLQWAAEHERVLLTHDLQTLPGFAYQRVKTGLPMAGVVEVPQELPLAVAVEDILLISQASNTHEWKDQVIFLPL